VSADQHQRGRAAGPLTIGRYQVTDRLGEGGMGIVYLARDPTLERFLAIKLMRHGFDNPDYRERFVREARTVASLRHPCIVTVFEYGDHDGQPFIVMEYVTGKTLAQMMAAGVPLSLTRRLQLAEDLCRGLDHAHKAGIVHRDVKPANVMVDSEGTLKILDFGIAKRDQATLTQLNVLVGTPTYMSPEQISGRPVTRRSDVFSVGLVFYELLANNPAFPGTSQFAVMNAILNSEPTPLASIVPGLDPRIIRIVEKALEKDVDRRYQDLAQMRRDIERLRMEFAVADPTFSSGIKAMPQAQVVQIEELSRRRAQQIAANLESAERAFELGDYDAALAACEDALILDPHVGKGLEGLQRAHAAIVERQALGHLSAARQHFERGELTEAEERLNAVSGLAPALMEGQQLRQQVASARERKEERARALKLALDRARLRFQQGAFESALRAADEALKCNPEEPEALRLKANAVAALEGLRQQHEIERRVQTTIDEARRLAARDRFDDARAVLEDRSIVSHPAIAQARAAIDQEQSEFVRLQAEAVARLEQHAMAQVRAARQHFDRGEWLQAGERLNAASELAPSLSEALELRQQLAIAVQREQDRARAVARALERARMRLDEGAFESAARAADEALEWAPAESEALRLKARAIAALEAIRQERERERHVQASVAEARQFAAATRYDDARRILEDPSIAFHPAVVEARDAVHLEEAEFVRRQAEAVARAERQAHEHVTAAHDHLSRGELPQAEARLTAAIALAPALADVEDLRKQIADTRRRQQERARAVMRALERARALFNERAFEAVVRTADEALEVDPAEPEALQLKTSALAALDARRRQRDTEYRVQKAIDEARRLAAAGLFEEARRALGDPAVAADLDAIRTCDTVELEPDTVRLREEVAATTEVIVTGCATALVPTVPTPSASVEPHAPLQGFVFSTRTILVPPDIVAVRGQVPLRRRPKPVSRPYVDLGIADRGGDREWFGDRIFVEGKTGHDSVGYGVSVTSHVAVAVAILLMIVARPVLPSIARLEPLAFMPVVPAPPVVETPKVPAPARTEPRPPKSNVDRTPPPPMVAAPGPAPAPGQPEAIRPAIPTNLVPIEPGLGLAVEPLAGSQPVGAIRGRPEGVPGGINEDPVDDFDQDPVLLNQVRPKIPVGASGVVRVEVTILSNGTVSRVRVLDHTPYDALIIDAATKCTFQPAKRRGKPVPVVIPLEFKLDTRR
jgi:TonB family protein